MGRKLYRVPLDFNWPLNKTWEGFLNPYYKFQIECTACKGRGESPDGKRLQDEWYGHAPFDPVAYGTPNPVQRDNPKIRALALRNVRGGRDFKLVPDIKHSLVLGNLTELACSCGYSSTKEDAKERAYDLLAHIESEIYLDRLVETEQTRLFTQCFGNHWSHNLIQADVDALVEDNRLSEFTRRPLNEEQAKKLEAQKESGGSHYWLDEPNGYHPTAEEINLWSIGGMGHDSINSWVCIKARAKREGVQTQCSECQGEGHFWPSEELKEKCENWEDEPPPEGPGYQLWETTSDGSPVSPVFKTLDELCKYAAKHCSTFGSNKTTAEHWREMLDADFVVHKEGNAIFL